MEKTAERLELAAEFADTVAEQCGEEMQALYLLDTKELTAAAAASSPCSGAEQSQEYNLAQEEGREKKSHYAASLQLHRMTGGGPKPSTAGNESGPMVTSLNPNRHVMMLHGRPVMVLSLN